MEFVKPGVLIVYKFEPDTIDKLEEYRKRMPDMCIIFYLVFSPKDLGEYVKDIDIGDIFITFNKAQYNVLVERYSTDYTCFAPFVRFVDITHDKLICDDMHDVYKNVIHYGKPFVYISDYPEFYRQDFPEVLHPLFTPKALTYLQENTDAIQAAITDLQTSLLERIDVCGTRQEIENVIAIAPRRTSLPVHYPRETRGNREKYIGSLIYHNRGKKQEIIYKATGDPSHEIDKLDYHSVTKLVERVFLMKPNVLNYTSYQHMLEIPDNILFDTDVNKTFGSLFRFYTNNTRLPHKCNWMGIVDDATLLPQDAFNGATMVIVRTRRCQNLLNCDTVLERFTRNPIAKQKPDSGKIVCNKSGFYPGAGALDKILNDTVVLDSPSCNLLYSCIEQGVPVYTTRDELSLDILGSEYPLYYTNFSDLSFLMQDAVARTDAYHYILLRFKCIDAELVNRHLKNPRQGQTASGQHQQ